MDRLLPHPATLQLLRFQFMAHGLRTWRRLRSPRRLALSALALILAMVWLGQVLLGILMREPADLEKLLSWIPLGLLAYTIWHLLKAACRTPIEPFEWTPAERELLMGAPLRRYDLVMVRLLAIAIAAAAKAACFAIVMVPDLRIVPAGWTGMFLALLFVDLLRMALDITVYGLSRREFLGFRLAVLGTAAVVFSMALVQALAGYDATQVGEFPASLAIPLRVVGALIDLQTTAIGSILVSPFRLFGNVILAQSYSIGLLMMFLSTVGLVALLAGGVVRLEELCRQRRVRGERQQYQQRQCDNHLIEVTASHSSASPLRVPRRWAGAGSLAWRQWLGALHYRTSLAVAMVVPAVLSCLTLLTPQRGFLMLVQLVGGLVFYSFLLLPTAFKFDFRRDIDRMAVLKALPLSSLMVTCGQLAVPVLLCTVFQLAVLLFALFVRPYPIGWLPAAILVLLPTNVVIFSLENVIFLLYPYRLHEEGLGVFLRSILTFTGKTVLFAMAMGVAVAWALAVRHVALTWFGVSAAISGLIFLAGLWLLVAVTAYAGMMALSAAYRRFDPSRDTPAG